ncbi:MAG TPA: hypothetical protein VME17_00255 [Bryobacteraceae bacterium]|nr:hypothetical protein [Bryobacteraceae bacterium]
MAVPPIPPPLAQLGGRPFSFYPAILNVGHNEWIYCSATWQDVLVRSTKTNQEVSVPRRYLGEISPVDAPVMIVGLRAELEYRAGAVWPAERRVIEMPRAVNDTPRPRIARQPSDGPVVVGIRIENDSRSRVGKLVVGGVALGVAGCVLAITLFRGGVIATRAFYAPSMRADLPLSPADNYSAVVRELGTPQSTRWRTSAEGEPPGDYELLVYPQRRLYVILMGHGRTDARYIGAMDWNWHPAHAVDLAGYGSSYRLLRELPRF